MSKIESEQQMIKQLENSRGALLGQQKALRSIGSPDLQADPRIQRYSKKIVSLIRSDNNS